MKKILLTTFLLLTFFFVACSSGPTKFEQTGYFKSNASDRIKIVAIDYYEVTQDEVLQHARKQANTAGQMTAVYYFHKTDRHPLSGFSTVGSISRANHLLYDSDLVDPWKYVYIMHRIGKYQFVDCTKEQGTGLCQGDN